MLKKKERSVLISEQIYHNAKKNLKRYQDGEIDIRTFLLNEKAAENQNLEDRAKLQQQAIEDFVLHVREIFNLTNILENIFAEKKLA